MKPYCIAFSKRYPLPLAVFNCLSFPSASSDSGALAETARTLWLRGMARLYIGWGPARPKETAKLICKGISSVLKNKEEGRSSYVSVWFLIRTMTKIPWLYL